MPLICHRAIFRHFSTSLSSSLSSSFSPFKPPVKAAAFRQEAASCPLPVGSKRKPLARTDNNVEDVREHSLSFSFSPSFSILSSILSSISPLLRRRFMPPPCFASVSLPFRFRFASGLPPLRPPPVPRRLFLPGCLALLPISCPLSAAPRRSRTAALCIVAQRRRKCASAPKQLQKASPARNRGGCKSHVMIFERI